MLSESIESIDTDEIMRDPEVKSDKQLIKEIIKER